MTTTRLPVPCLIEDLAEIRVTLVALRSHKDKLTTRIFHIEKQLDVRSSSQFEKELSEVTEECQVVDRVIAHMWRCLTNNDAV